MTRANSINPSRVLSDLLEPAHHAHHTTREGNKEAFQRAQIFLYLSYAHDASRFHCKKQIWLYCFTWPTCQQALHQAARCQGQLDSSNCLHRPKPIQVVTKTQSGDTIHWLCAPRHPFGAGSTGHSKSDPNHTI